MQKSFTVIFIVVFTLCFGILAYGDQPQPQQTSKAAQPHTVEFSDLVDRDTPPGGDAINLPPNPEFIIHAWPPDVLGNGWPLPPASSYDHGGDNEVDACANGQDLYFKQVVADRADLLLSFFGDPIVGPDNIAVWYEKWAGGGPPPNGPRWKQVDLNAAVPDNIDDLDGLEIWGGETGDAHMFSLTGDVLSGVSVWTNLAGPAGPPNVQLYINHFEIVNVIRTLGFTGDSVLVDLDAMMVWDSIFYDNEFTNGDEIIFSIRATGNWDGGEIVHWKKGVFIKFLKHGGHLWDTAFRVDLAFGIGTEEVDGLEAEPHVKVPSITPIGLIILTMLLIASGIYILYRRRRATV
jgi:hypothetical protein